MFVFLSKKTFSFSKNWVSLKNEKSFLLSSVFNRKFRRFSPVFANTQSVVRNVVGSRINSKFGIFFKILFRCDLIISKNWLHAAKNIFYRISKPFPFLNAIKDIGYQNKMIVIITFCIFESSAWIKNAKRDFEDFLQSIWLLHGKSEWIKTLRTTGYWQKTGRILSLRIQLTKFAKNFFVLLFLVF